MLVSSSEDQHPIRCGLIQDRWCSGSGKKDQSLGSSAREAHEADVQAMK